MPMGVDKAYRINQREAGIFTASGNLVDLASYALADGEPVNLILSGNGAPDDRYQVLAGLISHCVGRWPVVLLHAGDNRLVEVAGAIWSSMNGCNGQVPFWCVDPFRQEFEPFYGMPDMQVVSTVRKLAEGMGYTVTPRLERITRAHVEILHLLEVPTSLSGFVFLNSHRDMGEFRDNIMALPCSDSQSNRLWADLGVDTPEANDQFDLFRSVVDNLAFDAQFSGWDAAPGKVSTVNCITAIANNAVLSVSLDDAHTSLLLPYLAGELSLAPRPFFLIVDGISMTDESFSNLLLQQQNKFRFAVVGDNVSSMMGQDDKRFIDLANRASAIIMLKHATGSAAKSLSEVIGNFDAIRVDESTGKTRGFFSILPSDNQHNVSVTTENRYRVMPEEITALGEGQAIVFDVLGNQIIFYN